MIVVSASANAQEMKHFDNSWFWGFKSGINSFAVPGHGNTSTVDLGVDWVITRTRGGLYVSANQSVFERDLEFLDPTSNTGQRTVRVNDMRRITVAGLAFPKHFGGITPYAGLGFMIAVLGDTRVFVDGANSFPTNSLLDVLYRERSRSTAMVMGGVQIQTKRAAIFGQETLIPSNNSFLFRSVLNFFEFGIRINFGSSIDQD